jgi:hypothetical protein
MVIDMELVWRSKEVVQVEEEEVGKKGIVMDGEGRSHREDVDGCGGCFYSS